MNSSIGLLFSTKRMGEFSVLGAMGLSEIEERKR